MFRNVNTRNILYGITFCFILCSSLSGCTKTNYIVLRDVPISPSFVVIPVNNTMQEISYANLIERAILSSGFRVELRPASKEIEKTLTGPTDNNDKVQTLTERYFELEKLTADYLVQTYAASADVKVSKLSKISEVLTIVKVPRISQQYGENPRYIMMKVLSKLLNKTL